MDRTQPTAESPTWLLLLAAAEALTRAGRTPFSRVDLIQHVQSIDPARARATIDPIIQGMTTNASGGPAVACGDMLRRIARGSYVLLDGAATDVPSIPTAGSATLRAPSRRRRDRRALRVAQLIERFDRYVGVYDNQTPFDRTEQYARHRETIDTRRAYPDLADALSDEGYLGSVHSTLRAWGLGQRGSRLIPLMEFVSRIHTSRSQLEALDGARIEDPRLDAQRCGELIWAVIETLRIADNEAQIVAGTKTLHHLVPDLVPPMDRAWTGRFFDWRPEDLHGRQRAAFLDAWDAFARIARATQPSRLVGRGWRTSPSKILDNALIGYLKADDPACAQCGSVDLVRIVYGVPDRALEKAARRGEVELGGHMVREDSPTHRCRRCGREIAR